MRWLVTLELPNEDRTHHWHDDAANPEDAARFVRAVTDATGVALPYSIESFEGEWRCAECGAWRLELGEPEGS